jgi:hypothetical protein
MEMVCGTSELENFTSSITETASLCAARKNSLDPCTAPYQNIIITDYFIVDAINIWWQAPKTPEINTIATQYYTQAPNREQNTTCSEVPTPVTSRCCLPSSTFSSSLAKKFHQ